MQAPEVRREVDRAAADLLTVEYGRLLHPSLGFRRTKRIRLALPVIQQVPMTQELDLVMREIFLAQVRALLQYHDLEPCGGEFLCDHAARRAGADHDKVHYL